MTEYAKHNPTSTWSSSGDTGGDENVKYKFGKRQSIKANYKYGKQPRGTGSIGSGGTQVKGKK